MCLKDVAILGNSNNTTTKEALAGVSSTSTNNTTTCGKTPALKVLLCSENVPPQVNGIARRIGHYAAGLEANGCDVTLLHPECTGEVWPHVNPWNFTARMMMLLPHRFWSLVLLDDFDVVHAVMPLNLSGMWLLAGFKVLRLLKAAFGSKKQSPALVVSWHCNLVDYNECHAPTCVRPFSRSFLFSIIGVLPHISDRVVAPTRATDPKVTELWGKSRSGVCYTGISLENFHPDSIKSVWGQEWQGRKQAYLKETGKKFLLVCVSRLSVEKGIDELLKIMPVLDDCALWLVGDGPARPELEQLAQDLKVSVHFWGYQKGEALSTAYGVADCFVCPSLTETFGQTVNEALAMQVRVALPRVSVFSEAYGHVVPDDGFWEPLDRESMVTAIAKQLDRHAAHDPYGVPDRTKLKTWDQASRELIDEYTKAQEQADTELAFMEQPLSTKVVKIGVMLFLPVWWSFTVFLAIVIFLFSLMRTLVGGQSVRHFCKAHARKLKEAHQERTSKMQQAMKALAYNMSVNSLTDITERLSDSDPEEWESDDKED